jgi:uncharacterized membrane protein YcaP (DUF421 family)
MKSKTQTNKYVFRTPLLIASGALLLLLIFAVLEKTGTINLIDSNGASKQQKQESQLEAAQKKQFIENGDDSGSQTDTNQTTTEQSGQDNQSSANIGLTARQETNGTVTVLTKLYGYSNGSCDLAVTKGSATSAQHADVIYQSEFSTCAGFSVPINQVGTGTWNIKLTVTSDGSSATKNTTLEVK